MDCGNPGAEKNIERIVSILYLRLVRSWIIIGSIDISYFILISGGCEIRRICNLAINDRLRRFYAEF